MAKESPKLTSRQLAEASALMADPVPQIMDGEFKGEAIVEVVAPRPVAGLVKGPSVAGLVPVSPPVKSLPPAPVAKAPKVDYIVVIRSDRGTLHPALDEKHNGKGALATYDTAELAESAAAGNSICQKLQYYILRVG